MLEWFRNLFFGKKNTTVNPQITDAVTTKAPVVTAAMTGSLAATSMATAATMKPKRKYTKKPKTEKKV